MVKNDKELRRKLEQGLVELQKIKKENEKPLDVALIQQKLDNLFIATVNYIISRWPPVYNHLAGAPIFFQVTVNLSRHTYNTIRFLVADKRLKEHDWNWAYVFGLPALNRTILDPSLTLFSCLKTSTKVGIGIVKLAIETLLRN